MSSSLLTPFSTSVSIDQVNATTLPLPTGAATQTTLAAIEGYALQTRDATREFAFDAWLRAEEAMFA